MNELTINEDKLQIQPGKIDFPEYKRIKKQAQQLADGLASIKVTPDTLKTNKKLLAAVNKQVSALNQRRIDAHEEMDKPYKEFADQVKEISSIVDDAVMTVRSQEKELDEIERREKKDALSKMFDKRSKIYSDFPLRFDDFLNAQPNVLNKSITLKKSEELIANWFEFKNKDIEVIQRLPNSDKVMTKYVLHPDSLTEVLSQVQIEKEAEDRAKRVSKPAQTVDFDNYVEQEDETTATFVIYGTDETNRVIEFMNLNKINYKKL